MKSLKMTLAVAAVGAVAFAGAAQARDQIKIVGSSTVFPFSTAVAETFGRLRRRHEAVLRRRRRRASGHHQRLAPHEGLRVRDCQGNGVDEIVEVKIGYDGIAIANSKAPSFALEPARPLAGARQGGAEPRWR
jgi:phosphate transport system substrate-binding protein